MNITLTKSTRADTALNVEVIYDVNGVEVARRVLTFPENATVADVRAKATEIGNLYKTAIATQATLAAAVGTVIVI